MAQRVAYIINTVQIVVHADLVCLVGGHSIAVVVTVVVTTEGIAHILGILTVHDLWFFRSFLSVLWFCLETVLLVFDDQAGSSLDYIASDAEL